MTMLRPALLPAFFLLSTGLYAQLPDGAGKDAVLQICGNCHEPTVIQGHHLSRDEWVSTIQKMITEGAQGTEDQFNAILGYLVKNFGPQLPKVNVNQASAADLQSGLGLSEKEAAAVVKQREKGAYKTVEDLKKVPDLDYKKIEAQKDRVIF
jgi:competence protein ComEA